MAISYFKQAADIGHGEAQIMLAEAHKLGLGTPVEPLLTLFWFARAYEKGDTAGSRRILPWLH